jgi:hypothetical protein
VIRACLDVNVLVSGLPASSGVPAELIDRWLRREFELILSEDIQDAVGDHRVGPQRNNIPAARGVLTADSPSGMTGATVGLRSFEGLAA